MASGEACWCVLCCLRAVCWCGTCEGEGTEESASTWLLPSRPGVCQGRDVSATHAHQSNKNACSFCSERPLRTGVGVLGRY